MSFAACASWRESPLALSRPSAALLVTPYAHQLFAAQWHQSHQYNASPVAGAAASYHVVRISTSAPRPVVDEAADYGDGVGGSRAFSIARMTSLKNCSCQFPNSTGLPCRHQLAVARQLQVNDAGMLCLAPQWRLMSEEQRSALVQAMLSSPLPSLSVLPAPRTAMLKVDRFALLMSEFRGVAGAASETPALTEWAHGEIRRVAGALRPSAAPAAPAAAARPRGGARPAAAAAPTAQRLAARAALPGLSTPPAAMPAAAAAAAVGCDSGKQKCKTCGALGHNSNNRQFHPKPLAPVATDASPPPAGAAAPPSLLPPQAANAPPPPALEGAEPPAPAALLPLPPLPPATALPPPALLPLAAPAPAEAAAAAAAADDELDDVVLSVRFAVSRSLQALPAGPPPLLAWWPRSASSATCLERRDQAARRHRRWERQQQSPRAGGPSRRATSRIGRDDACCRQ